MEVERPPLWCLRIGATVEAVREGAVVGDFTGKAAVLLAWVAVEGWADRARLSSTLWPDSGLGQARNNLRVLVHRINQRCGFDLLTGGEQLTLGDVLVQRSLHDTESVLAALRIGGVERCELLANAGIGSDIGEELGDWLEAARRRFSLNQASILSDALALALANGANEQAVALARACVQLEPLSESRHRQLMDALIRIGDRAAALSAYEDCKQVLSQRLGVQPERRTRALQLRILQDHGQEPATEQAKGPEADGLTALGGAARYPLVERESVLKQAQLTLEAGAHVVVHGEPGVGKTRLLRHVAARWGGQVELVAIRSGGRQEAFAAISQILQEVHPRRTPRIDVPEQIELARLAPLAFAEVKPSEAALSVPRLHLALRRWMVRLSSTGVRLLVLDDLQYADPSSQAAIGTLLASVPPREDPPLALLLAYRSGEIESALEEAVVNSQVVHQVRSIALPRLSLEGVRVLLQSLLQANGPGAEAALRAMSPNAKAAQLYQRTGGNPLFVIELIQQSLERGEDGHETASLQALLISRLKGCSGQAQQLAAVAAVAGGDFTLELAVSVTGRTALGLMPAWAELQKRGLFAEHGLAHDLVQEAVLAELPTAIQQLLHQQVAQHMEQHGLRGAAVLRHWLAAEDADQALPHAMDQLHATSVAGLPVVEHELQVLSLLERCGDQVLMANLWRSAEVNGGMITSDPTFEAWPRLRALRQRVERLPPTAGVAGWIAFETARDHYYLGHSAKAAYEVLEPMSRQLPERGLERAWTEVLLAHLANEVVGEARAHVRNALRAVEGLRSLASFRRLCMEADAAAAVYLDPVEGIRALAARRRAGQRRGDLALVADTSLRLAAVHTVQGNRTRAFRHFCRAGMLQRDDGNGGRSFQPRLVHAVVSIGAGHYELARSLLEATRDPVEAQAVPLFEALLNLKLGDAARARSHYDRIDPAFINGFPALSYVLVDVCAELDQIEGRDPVPTLTRLLGPEQLERLGAEGSIRDRFAWELIRRTRPAAERIDAGRSLLLTLRKSRGANPHIVKLLLELAEAHAEARVPGAAELTSESARLLRRGYTTHTLYLPEGLLRCARLLRPIAPGEAESLLHVARRWVLDAVGRLSPDASDNFVKRVPTNRLLLGRDEAAVYSGRLH